MKIIKQRLKEIIKEELEAAIGGGQSGETFNFVFRTSSAQGSGPGAILAFLNNVTRDQLDNTDSRVRPNEALVQKVLDALGKFRGDVQIRLADPVADIVPKPPVHIDAGPTGGGGSDEEELVLKGPEFDPLGDSLQARRQRASVRR